MELIKQQIDCPTCGHRFTILLDDSRGDQDYYDDCPNCCSSYHVCFRVDSTDLTTKASVDADDEQYY